MAVDIRDLLRRACRAHSAIRLFQASPVDLALLLGNRWNRLRPTTVYEDVNAEQVYEKAFVIDALGLAARHTLPRVTGSLACQAQELTTQRRLPMRARQAMPDSHQEHVEVSLMQTRFRTS
ncbi:SAVED domain-containing protein [Streptomyces sp. NPDC005897]|uniref:SAVED domain-containing protein n=1 Tax=Streptomyces sp. NPDC005897 TaxID=3157081 RepID=UPI0033E038C9